MLGTKLIFLDMDGVLCLDGNGNIEQGLLGNLAKVVKETGAKVVLSSHWRRHPEVRQGAQEELLAGGVDMIGATPQLDEDPRPTEILKWLWHYWQENTGQAMKHLNWVAIDDRDLLDEPDGHLLRGHFVRTDVAKGLTWELAEECVAHLKGVGKKRKRRQNDGAVPPWKRLRGKQRLPRRQRLPFLDSFACPLN